VAPANTDAFSQNWIASSNPVVQGKEHNKEDEERDDAC